MKGFNKKYLGFGIAVAMLAGGVSCKRDGFSGPELSAATDGFELTTSFAVTDTIVNLGADETISFSAAFNQKVSWEIVVTGVKSGAEKTFTGIGEFIDPSQAIFEGRASSARFFSSDEYVRADLSILGLDSVYSIDSLETVLFYSYHRKVLSGVKHIVIDNFESSGAYKYSPVSLAVATDALDSDVDFIANESIVVEGDRSFKMAGTDVNNNGWTGGMNSENLVDFYLVGNAMNLLIDSGIAPEDLYFNMYIYGTGHESTAVQLKVYEYDHKSFVKNDSVHELKTREDMRFDIFAPGPPPLAKNPYDQGINDGWIYDVEVSWTGWKLVSIPYSEFRAANDLLFGGNGDRVKESWRICGMAVSLLAFPTTGVYTETYIDQLVITQGGRFQK